MFIKFSQRAKQGKIPRPLDDVALSDNNLILFTSLEEWTDCSACGKVGLRRRTGICTLRVIISLLTHEYLYIHTCEYTYMYIQANAYAYMHINNKKIFTVIPHLIVTSL